MKYIALTKPGILFGNAVTAIAGFFVATSGRMEIALFSAMLIGLLAIIASGCVINNCIDKTADAKMMRTKKRPLVTGSISRKRAMVFGALLLAVGVFFLAFFTTPVALYSALIGFFVYTIAYSLLKYRSRLATLVGSIAGAMPPVVGYTAVTGHMDLLAWLLFLIIGLWQMPHFYAIAIFRLDDYKAASIPVLPAVKSMFFTKVEMLIYTALFFSAVLLPLYFGFGGMAYRIVATILGGAWLMIAIQGFWAKDDRKWARGMFFFSLIVVMGMSVVMALDLNR